MSEHSTRLFTRLYLASGSPRRRELLGSLGISFEVESPDVDETPLDGELPAAIVTRLARLKAERVAAAHPGALALGADTLVALGKESLGKPKDAADARAMLGRLSGRSHEVWTAVALAEAGRETALRTEVSHVAFRALAAAEIDAYVASGEPLDKAGAYAIQGAAGGFVTELLGEKSTVVGLPLLATRAMLSARGALR